MRTYITSLTRKGVIDKAGTTETFGLLDKLTIGYSGNRLSWANASTDALPFEGMTGVGLNGVGIPFTYDASGRLNCDDLRGIESIEYDNNGHPVRIVFTSGNEQRDVWDGLGNHLATEYYTPQSMGGKEPYITKSYGGDGQVEYRLGLDTGLSFNKVLRYTQFAGGYFDQNSAPHYYVTDYQGNITGTVNSVPEIEEETNYYPYGEPWREIKDNPFTFSGNERLPNDGLNEYDFNARRYYAALPAFSSWDALNEQYPWLSPYAYCAGNPIRMIDPSGNRITVWEDGEEWEYRIDEYGSGFYNANNEIYTGSGYLIEIQNALDKIRGGDVGKILIDELINSSKTLEIKYINGKDNDNDGSSYFNYAQNLIGYKATDPISGPSLDNNLEITNSRPPFIALAHELAHAYDKIINNQGNTLIWDKIKDDVIAYSDIFAGNVENCIRYENRLPIRIAYKSLPHGVFSLRVKYYFSEMTYKLILSQMQHKAK